jgi:putative transposase
MPVYKGLKSTAQTRYDLRYHFVFIPKYRKRVLEGKIKERIEGMIKFACQIHEWEIFELAVQPDHVHLYVGTPPKWSPSQVMNIIKGGTSRKIRELFPDLDEIYWGSTFWADGYLVKSVGDIQDKVVSDYIKRQS